jgi:hypothetical protein
MTFAVYHNLMKCLTADCQGCTLGLTSHLGVHSMLQRKHDSYLVIAAAAAACRNLHRCRHLAVHAELVQLQSNRVMLTDDSRCHGCGRLIGGTVFVVLPSGVVMCSRCSGAAGSLTAEAAAGG